MKLTLLLSSLIFTKNTNTTQCVKLYSNIMNKKLISISPGGVKGFYMMGTCAYLKKNYDLKNYIFSGASAGSWNSLFMTFNKNPETLVNALVDNRVYTGKSICEIEHTMKKNILLKFSTPDFDLDKLFIGVTTIGQTNIYYNFADLEDAIDCCIASSHIPFITGGLINKYKNTISFDGGFSSYPYLNNVKPVLHITPTMWTNKKEGFYNYRHNLFIGKNSSSFDFEHLYKQGYIDAENGCKNNTKLDISAILKKIL